MADTLFDHSPDDAVKDALGKLGLGRKLVQPQPGHAALPAPVAMSIAAPPLAVFACGFAEGSELGRHLLKQQRRPCKLNATHLGVGLAGDANPLWYRRPSGQKVALIVGSAPFHRNKIWGAVANGATQILETPADDGGGCSSGAAAFSL